MRMSERKECKTLSCAFLGEARRQESPGHFGSGAGAEIQDSRAEGSLEV